jgi:UDP:flavonoid glycosyltransferase YjiC (YdhE family)
MGVPMLALPSHLEQQVGMSILKREGFGRMGCSRRITGDQLLAEIRTLVEDPSYRANAWRFRNAVKHSDGRALGAEILVRHARAHAGAAVVAAG